MTKLRALILRIPATLVSTLFPACSPPSEFDAEHKGDKANLRQRRSRSEKPA
ncbi:hypothetical protein WN48_03933 [Eufriesea mexicana]|nr:hypothetical protein WN48_03933 [Eufriesea mexicana]